MKHCKWCYVFHDTRETRSSKWVVNEDCDFCVSLFRKCTRPKEYQSPRRALRSFITEGMRTEREALKADIRAVKAEVRKELGPIRKDRTDFNKRARAIGLDPDTMWELYAEHDHCCDICGTHEDESRRRLCMDHCHETGRFRGFLCRNCNSGIGLLGDNADGVAAALKYLET